MGVVPDRLGMLGVRRYDKSLVEVTGARSNSVKEVVRKHWNCAGLLDRGVTGSGADGVFATLSWAAADGAGAGAGRPRANFYLNSFVHYRGVLRKDDFPRNLQRPFIAWTGNVPVGVLLSAATFGACHFYPGSESRGSDCGVWRVVRSIGAGAKEHTSRNDYARAA